MNDLFPYYSPELFRPTSYHYLLPEPYRKRIRRFKQIRNTILAFETSLDYTFRNSNCSRNPLISLNLLKSIILTMCLFLFIIPIITIVKYSLGVLEWSIKQQLPYPLSSEDSLTIFGKQIYRGVEVRTDNSNTIHHGSPLEATTIFSYEIKSLRNLSHARRLYGNSVAQELEHLYEKLKIAKEALELSANEKTASKLLKDIKKQHQKLKKNLPNRKFSWKLLRYIGLTFMINKMVSDMSGEQGWNDINRLGHKLGDGTGPLKGGPFDWGYYDICDFLVDDLGLEGFRLLGWNILFLIREIIALIFRGIESFLRKIVSWFL